MTETSIRIEGHIKEGQALDTQGHAVHVTVIQGGQSKNGFTYNEAVLQAIAQLLEGAQAYVDHAASDNDPRSVRDIVGFYHDARYVPPGAASTHGRVDATLHIMEGADWLWSLIQEACTLGHPELIGLSIDIFGPYHLYKYHAPSRDVSCECMVILTPELTPYSVECSPKVQTGKHLTAHQFKHFSPAEYQSGQTFFPLSNTPGTLAISLVLLENKMSFPHEFTLAPRFWSNNHFVSRCFVCLALPLTTLFFVSVNYGMWE